MRAQLAWLSDSLDRFDDEKVVLAALTARSSREKRLVQKECQEDEADEERGEDAEQKTVQRPAHVFWSFCRTDCDDDDDDFDEKKKKKKKKKHE